MKPGRSGSKSFKCFSLNTHIISTKKVLLSILLCRPNKVKITSTNTSATKSQTSTENFTDFQVYASHYRAEKSLNIFAVDGKYWGTGLSPSGNPKFMQTPYWVFAICSYWSCTTHSSEDRERKEGSRRNVLAVQGRRPLAPLCWGHDQINVCLSPQLTSIHSPKRLGLPFPSVSWGDSKSWVSHFPSSRKDMNSVNLGLSDHQDA